MTTSIPKERHHPITSTTRPTLPPGWTWLKSRPQIRRKRIVVPGHYYATAPWPQATWLKGVENTVAAETYEELVHAAVTQQARYEEIRAGAVL